MNIDRMREEIREDLAKGTDVPKEERFDDVLGALAELAARETPETEIVELLLDTAEATASKEFEASRAARVQRAASGRPEPERIETLLARERRRSHLSLEQAASVLGVAAQVLDQVEAGTGVARILKVPARNVRRFTDQLGIAYQDFLLSLGASLPRPSGFVYAYRPRDSSGEAAAAQDAERNALTHWVEEYAAAR